MASKRRCAIATIFVVCLSSFFSLNSVVVCGQLTTDTPTTESTTPPATPSPTTTLAPSTTRAPITSSVAPSTSPLPSSTTPPAATTTPVVAITTSPPLTLTSAPPATVTDTVTTQPLPTRGPGADTGPIKYKTLPPEQTEETVNSSSLSGNKKDDSAASPGSTSGSSSSSDSSQSSGEAATAKAASSKSTKKSSNILPIVLSVGGGVVLLATIVIVFVLVKRKKDRTRESDLEDGIGQRKFDVEAAVAKPVIVQAQSVRAPGYSYKELSFRTDSANAPPIRDEQPELTTPEWTDKSAALPQTRNSVTWFNRGSEVDVYLRCQYCAGLVLMRSTNEICSSCGSTVNRSGATQPKMYNAHDHEVEHSNGTANRRVSATSEFNVDDPAAIQNYNVMATPAVGDYQNTNNLSFLSMSEYDIDEHPVRHRQDTHQF